MQKLFKSEEGWSFSFFAEVWDRPKSLSLYADSPHAYTSMQVVTEDVVTLGLLHRAIGHMIDSLQPGVISPLPEDSPDLVDALKVRHEIDRIWMEKTR